VTTTSATAPRAPLTSRSPDVLRYVLEFVRAAGVGELPVHQGWPTDLGELPALGVARGPQAGDGQPLGTGTFAGEVVALDEDGVAYSSATYYVHPQSTDIVVELLHHDPTERDRLHEELQLALAPLGRALQTRDALVREVTVTGRKRALEDPAAAGALAATAHTSLFTVRVAYELLEARDVAGPESVTDRVEVSVTVTDTTA